MTDIDLFSQMLLSAKVNFFVVVLGNVLYVSFFLPLVWVVPRDFLCLDK